MGEPTSGADAINDLALELWAIAHGRAVIEDAIVLMEKELRALCEQCAEIAEKTVCDQHLPTGIKIYGTQAGKQILAAFAIEANSCQQQ